MRSPRFARHLTAIAVALGAIVVGTTIVGPARAEEEPLDFLHALQKAGLGDVAVDFLRSLEAEPPLPEEIKEVWDLELSNSLRLAANDAYNKEDAKKLLAESQQHLDKFVKENPQHPAMAGAMTSWGDSSFHNGVVFLRAARDQSDPVKQAAQMKDARAALEEARPRYQQAVVLFAAQLKAALAFEEGKPSTAPKTPPRGAKRPPTDAQAAAAAARQAVEGQWLEARFKVALVDFWVGNTYPPADPKKADEPRNKALKTAAKEFDGIFQAYRNERYGAIAHLWHGRALGDMGDIPTALDIFEEVLSAAPDPDEMQLAAGMEGVFADAELFRFQLLVKQGKQKAAVAEAVDWLKLNQRGLKHTSGYQGLAFELVKIQLAAAETATGEAKTNLLRNAKKSLDEIVKVPSEYRQEALLLRRELSKKGTADPGVAGTPEEALAVAAEAFEDGKWDEAAKAYARAIELLETSKKPNPNKAEQLTDAQEHLARARYNLAIGMFRDGKLAEAVDAGGKIVKELPDTTSAASAAALAATAAFRLYLAAPEAEKVAAKDRFFKIADFVIAKFPGRPEADDARILVGQVSLTQNDLDRAIEAFKKVNPQSPRYGDSMYNAGQASWKRYRIELAKPEKSRDAEKMPVWLKNAEQLLAISLEAQRKSPDAEGAAAQLVDTQLMLAEIHYDSKRHADAVKYFQPLVNGVKESAKKAALDNIDKTTMRIILGAVRNYLALNDIDKAGEVALVLTNSGADTSPVNAALVEFARLLVRELQRAEAAEITAASGTDRALIAAAKEELTKIQTVLGKILEQLAPRKENTLVAMVFIGDTCLRVGQYDAARDVYQRVLTKAEGDEEFRKTAGPAMTRIRAQLVSMLRSESKYGEALQQIDKLLEANPTALELMMERGRILQAWAKTDAAHFDEAVAQWTKLRTTLSKMKKKPPEYYEVIYNAALCLSIQAETIKDASKANQAEQLLKATLILSPSLSGPDMVARFNGLLKKVIAAQGRPAS